MCCSAAAACLLGIIDFFCCVSLPPSGLVTIHNIVCRLIVYFCVTSVLCFFACMFLVLLDLVLFSTS